MVFPHMTDKALLLEDFVENLDISRFGNPPVRFFSLLTFHTSQLLFAFDCSTLKDLSIYCSPILFVAT